MSPPPRRWRWLNADVLQAVHHEQLDEHGGAAGMRDERLFESALARPLNLALYGQPDVFDLAAAYAVALAKKSIHGRQQAHRVCRHGAVPDLERRPTDGRRCQRHPDHARRCRRRA